MNTTTLTGARRRWPWALGGTALVLIVLAAVAAVLLAAFVDASPGGFNLVVDDDSFTLMPPGFEAGWGAVLVFMLAILTVLVVVPLVLLLVGIVIVAVLGLVALAVAAALASAVVAVLIALAVATSPLWLLGLLLWWLLRRNPSAGVTA
jgi:hypothetical protein